ncbi:hypothetical protein NitYY0826_C0382 [Nitratiruptor sp. YY08-26]|nr:hypothetical protein NitYY0813_C0381 [Nitratiruptor sp. YY08-13]BCD65461.1 hypothetical protein NitYY0826_C0382 [Nitratiruptor sp. YY08-26]
MAALLFLQGCSVKEVKPWQKGTLAKESMQQGACAKRFSKFLHHIYFSKEASKGGGGIGGGGCGCN